MELKALEKETIINTYNRQPETTLLLERGAGVYVWDDAGKRYLDFVSGLAVNNLGHCHPQIVEAICRQARQLMHTSNLYYTEPQIRLAEQLVRHSCAEKVFFCNSGAEANEAAIKLARKYGKVKKGQAAFEIVTAKRSFHGRTLAAVTATGQTKYHQGFEPMVAGFRYAEFNNLQSFKDAVTEQTCAILVEPVQGEGGVYPATPEFLQGLRQLCDEEQLLLIFDEVQCGMGRTGKLFAYQHYNVEPDIFTLAKALGGGLPIGVMAAKGEAAVILQPGEHASTFGGNPVVCAAANTAVSILADADFLKQAAELGAYFQQKLRAINNPNIVEVRGLGLMVGMEIKGDAARAVPLCQDKGLLVNCIGGKTLRFLPPLIVTKADIDTAVSILEEVLSAIA
ncbi:MAG TPA: acetylornithine transaminase [Firmicutes bacterium]|jgi:acetylornithine/N-succinyldiaminopimelate aminotransferase|nr:acetylornithine transaminase [Bacillota bacterium]HAA37484.1 acetylornithine transaminase [Bacillota bacterium]